MLEERCEAGASSPTYCRPGSATHARPRVEPRSGEARPLTIPEGHRFETTQALRQAIRWAGKAGVIERHHPILDVANPQPTRSEKQPFASWEDVEALAEEIDPRFASLIIFAAATGLRPGEWAALEWADLDLKASTPSVTVQRRLTKDGKIDLPKNGRPRRVPLRPRAIAALAEITRRIDTRLVFPAAHGGYIDLHNWRERHWHPAMISAGFVTADGKPDRGPYRAPAHLRDVDTQGRSAHLHRRPQDGYEHPDDTACLSSRCRRTGTASNSSITA